MNKKEFDQAKRLDSHGATYATFTTANVEAQLECIYITFPVTGWYKLAGTTKEIYFVAGDQLKIGGPIRISNPKSGDTKNNDL